MGKNYQNCFDRVALWRVYVYLLSSISMQKENFFLEFRSPDKNPLRKIQLCGAHLWCPLRP